MQPIPKLRPYALTIGGLDPCSAAGITADIKTMESNLVYGMAVCTSVTCQNDIEFFKIKWLTHKEIISQLNILLKRFVFTTCKIGIIKDFKILVELLFFLKKQNNKIKIIWDPILKSTTGFNFHNKIKTDEIEKVCSKIDLITPNPEEMKCMYPDLEVHKGAERLSRFCNVFLKSSTISSLEIKDSLFIKKKEIIISGARLKDFTKRGTGCVTASSIAANLALGFSLIDSCKRAKLYTYSFIRSNGTKLGYHNLGKVGK